MGFPKKLLADHEKLVLDLRPHWIAMVPMVLWAVVLLAAWVIGYQLVEDRSYAGTAQNVIAIVALLGIIWLSVIPFLRWRFTMFVLTSDRLITRSGVIAKHSKEIPLERINDVSFNQTALERALGAGDLMVESAGERGQTLISNVRKPEQVQLTIYKQVESNNERMMRPGSPRAEQTVTQQLEDLARLKEQGIITETEFLSKKQELLKRL